MDRLTVKRVFSAALENGAKRLSFFEADWELSGDCISPVRFSLFQRKGAGFVMPARKSFACVEDTFTSWVYEAADWKPRDLTFGEDKQGPYSVNMVVRCRKCSACLRRRGREWVTRIKEEISLSSRTWMGTLTLRPQAHYNVWLRALRGSRLRGVAPETLTGDEQLLSRHRIISREHTLMIKRLRKAGHRFRYVLVLEAHASGLPHYHMLVHEIGEPIRKRELEAQWPLGFSNWRLVDDTGKGAWYVAKYLSKSALARVRASVEYGAGAPMPP